MRGLSVFSHLKCGTSDSSVREDQKLKRWVCEEKFQQLIYEIITKVVLWRGQDYEKCDTRNIS